MKQTVLRYSVLFLLLVVAATSAVAKSGAAAGKLYTSEFDFRQGVIAGLDLKSVNGQLQLENGVNVGLWSVVHDSRMPGTAWGTICWNALLDEGSTLIVRGRSSQDKLTWNEWRDISNESALVDIPDGRYLEVAVFFQTDKAGASPVLFDLTVLPYADLQSLFEATLGTEGDLADIDGAEVTSVSLNFFYIDDDDHCSRIRVYKPNHGLMVGDKVKVFGALRYMGDGEKYIAASVLSSCETPTTETASLITHDHEGEN